MIRSMTGFGRASFAVAGAGFDVEVRSVNHRYLDVRIKLPRVLAAHEPALKAQVQAGLSRGKVDVSVNHSAGGVAPTRLSVDWQAAADYVAAAQELAARHGEGAVSAHLEAGDLLGMPGVARFGDPELPEQELAEALRASLAAALEAVDAMRLAEGEALQREIAPRLERIRELAESVAARSSEIQQAARERLRKRAESLRQETGLLDEARLHQEIVLAADRLDITEEVVRLRSHVEQFEAVLASAERGAPVGRRLDFLLQELGREANTIGSKGSDAPVAHDVVELKTELERIREQVQNVE